MSRLIAYLICASLSASATADYLAYSLTDTDRSPLPRKINKIQPKYLVNLAWGDYDGKRSRVGVMQVDNTSSAGSFTIATIGGTVDYGGANTQVPINGIEAIITDTINRTGRFRLVEQQVLGDVASGRVSAPSGAATGKVLGAQYLVQVVVTDYESKTRGSGSGLGGFVTRAVPALGSVGINSGEGRVGLNFRLIDAVTREIVYTNQIDSLIKEGGFTVSGGALLDDVGLGGFYSSYKKMPIGQAMIAGINQGVYELAQQIGAEPVEGSVIKADATEIWINLGAAVVSTGDQLKVLKKGEELIDPETGISLGSSDTLIGNIEVRKVQEKFSIARPASLYGAPGRGDKVISLAPPPSIEFAPSFRVPRR